VPFYFTKKKEAKPFKNPFNKFYTKITYTNDMHKQAQSVGFLILNRE